MGLKTKDMFIRLNPVVVSTLSILTPVAIVILSLFVSFSGAFAAATQLPKTGQTASYAEGDDGYWQAGAAGPKTRFSVNGDCMTDNLTGLMWTKDANRPNKTDKWQDALDFANNLSLCGYTDWRLPNINELESLVDVSKYNIYELDCLADASKCTPSIPTGHPFVNVQPDGYWSSTTHAKFTDSAWYIYMFNGGLYKGSKWGYFYVWPVRGGQTGPVAGSAVAKTGQTKCYDSSGTEIACAGTGQDGDIQAGVTWPSPRFTVGTASGADCVSDALTGLMWTKNVNLPNGYQTWQQALDYANNLNLCGYTDWRLPNRKELFSLFDYSKYSPSLPAGHPFTKINTLFNEQLFHWSSTTYAHGMGLAWFAFVKSDYELVNNTWTLVNYGYENSDLVKSDSSYVWPVRGGLVGPLSNADIVVSPSTKDFGKVNIGDTSPAQTFTISNPGVLDLAVSSINVTGGDSSMFSVAAANCASLAPTVTPGANCTITVTFAPTSAGAKATTLRIMSNDPDTADLDIALSGTGFTQYTLTVIPSGSGSGSVSGPNGLDCIWSGNSSSGTCEISLDVAAAITLSAGADIGSSFTGWKNGSGSASSCSDTGSCLFDISSNSSVAAVFSKNEACGCLLSPQSKAFKASGGSGKISVKTTDACSWTAESDSDWLTVSGADNKKVRYSVSANSSTSPRSGTIAIGNQIFTVIQDGVPCKYSISPANWQFTAIGGLGGFTVSTSDGCGWTTAVAGAAGSWLTVNSGSGSGSGPVDYTAAANNTSNARTGKINILGSDGKVKKTFTVKQSI